MQPNAIRWINLYIYRDFKADAMCNSEFINQPVYLIHVYPVNLIINHRKSTANHGYNAYKQPPLINMPRMAIPAIPMHKSNLPMTLPRL